jgi:hypothetical protein
MAEAAVKEKDNLGMGDDDLPEFEVIEDATLAGKPEQMRFERPGESDEDDDDGHAKGGQVDDERDARLNAEDDESEDDRRRSRQDKKRIRALAKERDRLKIEAMEREVQELRTGTHQMMERIHSQDTYIVEQRYNEAQSYKQRADFAYDQAVAKQDAAAMNEARRHQEEAGRAMTQLRELHTRLTQNKPQQRGPAPDPVIQAKASKFISERAPWYDPKAQDADSRVMAAIDVKLSSEGYDARSDEYWEELERRAATQLPDRFSNRRRVRERMDRDDDDGEDRGRRRDAPAGVGSDRARGTRSGNGKVVVRLSPERVRALQETGEWDDPKARAQAIRDYQKYDQESRATRR